MMEISDIMETYEKHAHRIVPEVASILKLEIDNLDISNEEKFFQLQIILSGIVASICLFLGEDCKTKIKINQNIYLEIADGIHKYARKYISQILNI